MCTWVGNRAWLPLCRVSEAPATRIRIDSSFQTIALESFCGQWPIVALVYEVGCYCIEKSEIQPLAPAPYLKNPRLGHLNWNENLNPNTLPMVVQPAQSPLLSFGWYLTNQRRGPPLMGNLTEMIGWLELLFNLSIFAYRGISNKS